MSDIYLSPPPFRILFLLLFWVWPSFSRGEGETKVRTRRLFCVAHIECNAPHLFLSPFLLLLFFFLPVLLLEDEEEGIDEEGGWHWGKIRHFKKLFPLSNLYVVDGDVRLLTCGKKLYCAFYLWPIPIPLRPTKAAAVLGFPRFPKNWSAAVGEEWKVWENLHLGQGGYLDLSLSSDNLVSDVWSGLRA